MMSQRDLFLNQFDPSIVPYIIEFGKRISSLEADVFILMARKAACFIDCLETLKLTSLSGIVTSDRVLDMETTWLQGKRVAIIDDAVISGTTIHQVTKAVRLAGAACVSTIAFCVNKDWWSSALAQPDGPFLELSDQETTTFCANIVDALSLVPRPYSVDYPLFSGLRILAKDLYSLSAVTGWEAHDVTSSLQSDHDVFSISAIPEGPVLSALDRSLGWNISGKCQLAKIRIYGRRPQGDTSAYWCRALPIVALDPLRESELDGLWESLVSSGGARDGDFERAFHSPTSRLRLVQYVAGTRLARLWFRRVEESLGRGLIAQQDLRMSCYIFPPHLADRVRQLSETDLNLFREAPRLDPALVPLQVSILG